MKEELKKLRIVCDTNVLLSMLGFPGGRLGALWGIIMGDQVNLFTSSFILEELTKNLILKARLGKRETAQIIELIKNHARVISPKQQIHVIQEKESDNRILECAVEADADVLVTGNFKHIRPLGSFEGIEILTPREFLDKYFPNL